MARRDYYETLGVDRNAGEDEIKRAYRTLAMKFHPDRNQEPGAVDRMKEVNEAYAVLCDPEKRRLYDAYGHAGLEGMTQADIFRGVDFSSIFQEFGLGESFGLGGLFESIFGGRTATRQERRRGADLKYELTITLEEAASGVEKTLELPQTEKCPVCGGTGAKVGGVITCDKCRGTGRLIREHQSGGALFQHVSVCDKCHGEGKIVKEPCPECQARGFIETTKEIKVKIPAGADTGYAVKVRGEGERGESQAGDLYVEVNVAKHPVFERHGDDIYIQQDIDFTTAALGGEIEAPGMDGVVKVDVPEGTQTGSVFRVGGKGMQRLNGHGKGDEYVIVKTVTPTHLDKREIELLKEFEKLRAAEKEQGKV